MFLRISSFNQVALSLSHTLTLVSLSLRFFLTKFFHPSLRAQFARATRLKKKKPYPIYYLLPISLEPVTLTTMPKLYTIRPSFTAAYSVRNRFPTRNYMIQQPWFHLASSAFPGQSVRAASRSTGKKKKKKKKKRKKNDNLRRSMPVDGPRANFARQTKRRHERQPPAKRNFPRNLLSRATASISFHWHTGGLFRDLTKIWTATLDSGYLEILILKPKIIFHTLFSQGFVSVCFRLSIFPCPLLYARAISSSRWNDDNGNTQRITVRVVSPINSISLTAITIHLSLLLLSLSIKKYQVL